MHQSTVLLNELIASNVKQALMENLFSCAQAKIIQILLSLSLCNSKKSVGKLISTTSPQEPIGMDVKNFSQLPKGYWHVVDFFSIHTGRISLTSCSLCV